MPLQYALYLLSTSQAGQSKSGEITAAVDRSDRSVERAIGSIDSITFRIFLARGGDRDLSDLNISALYDA